MSEVIEEITFRQVGNSKWMKCNQTGKRVKRSRCRQYARSLFNSKHRKRTNNIPKEAINLPRVTLSHNGNWFCSSNNHLWGAYNFSPTTNTIGKCRCGRKVWILGE